MDHNQGGRKLLLGKKYLTCVCIGFPPKRSAGTRRPLPRKMIKIPVRREELVIERKYLIPDEAGTDLRVESTRYVLREERLHYQVRPFDIQTVRIDKRSVQGFHPTEVTLKKEILALKVMKVLLQGLSMGKLLPFTMIGDRIRFSNESAGPSGKGTRS